MGSTAQLAALLAVVLGLAVAVDAARPRPALLSRPGEALAVLAAPVLVALLVAEGAVYRRVWSYDFRYVSGWTLPRRLPVEEVLSAVTVAVVALVAHALVRSRDGQAPSASPSADRPGGMRAGQWAGLVLVVAAVAVAGLAVVEGFARSAEGREVRAELRRTSNRLLGVVDVDFPDVTVLVLAIAVGVVALELGLLRTGAFRRRSTWLTAGVLAVYSVVIDGWAAKPSSPIVRYAPDEYLARLPGIGLPVDIVAMRVLAGIGVALGAAHLARRRARDGAGRGGAGGGRFRSGGRASGPVR